MLLQLDIENVAVFEKATIDFESGLNVITGETGAGKSLLINSLNMVLGSRTTHEIIRNGAQFARVSAVFFANDLGDFLSEKGIECDDGNIVLSRKLFADGRNLCHVNGSAVSVSVLREIGEKLVVIHGQRDSGLLLSPSNHLSFIDGFADNSEILQKYRDAYHEYKKASSELEKMCEDEAQRAREMDFLEFEINEIENAALSPDEEDVLTERKHILENAGELSRLAYSINSLLSDDNGAQGRLYSASRDGEKLSGIDSSMQPFSEKLTEIYYEIQELSRDISSYASGIDFDNNALNEIEDRLDVINTLKRKYGDTVEKILEHLNFSQKRFDELSSFDENRATLEKASSKAFDEAQKTGKKLCDIRKKAASALAEKLCSELESLDMPSSRIEFSFTPCGLSENGIETAEMLLSTNPAESLKSVGKIASGGELSRIMLAIKSVFSDFDRTPTLLFDEIDTGVSGRAAEKIAAKMRSLSQSYQLICITHLPIIAAAGDNHILIEKHLDSNGVTTQIMPLSPQEREREIARLISGDSNIEASVANAREMLSSKNK